MALTCDLCGGDHAMIQCRLATDALPVLGKADRRSALPQPPLEPCGTYAAARRHRRDGLGGRKLRDVCPACALAERAYLLPLQRAWRRRNFAREQERLRQYNAGRQAINREDQP